MATTNFSSLTSYQKKTWSRDVWHTARQNSFVMQMAGKGPNSAIQRITELTRSERGTQAVITLVADLANDGAMGDAAIEDNEEAIKAYDQQVQVDQIRNANKIAGRIAEQKSVVKFRETSRDVLGYWLANIIDGLAFNTLSGIDYRIATNGAARTGFTGTGVGTFTRTAAAGYALYDLAFAADVTAPSTNRYFRWDGTNKKLVAGSTTTIAAADTPSYAMLVAAKAYAKQRRLRSLKAGAGQELYHVFMHPSALAKLKLDSDFLSNVRNAGVRGDSNPLFSGSVMTVDGLVIHENINVFNTLGATTGTGTNAGWSGYKWGSTAAQDGSHVLFLGAQALAFVDLGAPEWTERDHFDYGNTPGIAVSKLIGFKKPVFYSPYDGGTNEDFGVMVVACAI
jgi:N4-gp56 family major capsid protein